MLKKAKGLKPVVERLLLDFPDTRDNDNLLMLKVWALQFPDLRNPQTSVSEFTSRFLSGKFAPSESILRTRQAVQQKNPALRGKLYEQRQREEKRVRKAVREGDLFGTLGELFDPMKELDKIKIRK